MKKGNYLFAKAEGWERNFEVEGQKMNYVSKCHKNMTLFGNYTIKQIRKEHLDTKHFCHCR